VDEVCVGSAAAHEYVLAIVYLGAGVPVNEGVGASAKVGTALQERHAVTIRT